MQEVRYLPFGEIKQILLCIHGFKGSKSSSIICALGQNLINHGILVIAFDFPYHGKNLKKFSLTECIAAVKNANIQLRAQFPNIPLSIFATSFGAYLILCCLGEEQYKYDSVIFKSPAIHMEKVYERIDFQELGTCYDEEFHAELVQKNLMSNFVNLGNHYFHVIQGKKDELVDWQNVDFFFKNKCPNRHNLYYFKDGNHRLNRTEEIDEITKITIKILMENS